MADDATNKLECIYFDALEIESLPERKAYLDRACEGDAHLRSQVERWLVLQPEVERFFADFDAD